MARDPHGAVGASNAERPGEATDEGIAAPACCPWWPATPRTRAARSIDAYRADGKRMRDSDTVVVMDRRLAIGGARPQRVARLVALTLVGLTSLVATLVSTPATVDAALGTVPAGWVVRIAVPDAIGGKTVIGQLTVDRAAVPGTSPPTAATTASPPTRTEGSRAPTSTTTAASCRPRRTV